METVFDSRKNFVQDRFLRMIMLSASGKTDYRYLFYGGAIRGGKTFVCLAGLGILLEKYKGTRAHVIRESLPSLQQTTIPSFKKLGFKGKWRTEGGSIVFRFLNSGSELVFFSEAFAADKDGDRFKGLETNFILLEQIEELHEQTWQRSIERVGSYYVEHGIQPEPLIMSTFNPTQNWVKDLIYVPWEKGELKSPYLYMHASPKDNPFVTAAQWKNWEQMDRKSYSRFVEGSWEDFDTDLLFAYRFERRRHVVEGLEVKRELNLFLSFDFNIDPMTCVVVQQQGFRICVVDEFCLPKSDIKVMCERILQRYRGFYFVVTGDASGKNRHGISGVNVTYYSIIRDLLRLAPQQMKVMEANAPVESTRLVMNSLLERKDRIVIDSRCGELIRDLESVKSGTDGGIDKKLLRSDRGHLLDGLRYYLYYFHSREVLG
jgi:hypothetical protein